MPHTEKRRFYGPQKLATDQPPKLFLQNNFGSNCNKITKIYGQINGYWSTGLFGNKTMPGSTNKHSRWYLKIKMRGEKRFFSKPRHQKTFDSTSHRYLQLVYSCFIFGPNLIRWLNLISTNRRACIILDNEFYSSYFDLDLCRLWGEIFGSIRFLEGSVLLFGSASYLARVGTSVYAKDWIAQDLPPHSFDHIRLPGLTGTRNH